MVDRCVVKVIFISLFVVISGSATAQSLEMSRSDTAFHNSPPSADNLVLRQFRSETPFLIDFGAGSEGLGLEALEALEEHADAIIEHHDKTEIEFDLLAAPKGVATMNQVPGSGVLRGEGGKQEFS